MASRKRSRGTTARKGSHKPAEFSSAFVGMALITVVCWAFWSQITAFLLQQELLAKLAAEQWITLHRGLAILITVWAGLGILLALAGLVWLALRSPKLRWLRKLLHIRWQMTQRRVIKQWPRLTGSKSTLHSVLADSEIKKERATLPNSWALRVKIMYGHHFDEVVELIPNLTSIFEARPGSVRVYKDANRSDIVHLRVLVKDPLRATIPWVPLADRSCTQPMWLGLYEDGKRWEVNLSPSPGQQMNMLVAGLTGMGKTSFLTLLIANLAACRDAVMGGIDNGGGGFTRWRPVFNQSLLALDLDSVPTVLSRLEKLIERRAMVVAPLPDPVWTPTPNDPDVYFLVDEAADLPDFFDRLFYIARKGRKYGVHLILATQRPSAAVLSKDLLSQLQVVVCFHVGNAIDVDVVYGPGSAKAGWRTDLYCNKQGEAMMRVHGDDPKVRAKAAWMDSLQVIAWAGERASHQPELRLPKTPKTKVAVGPDLPDEDDGYTPPRRSSAPPEGDIIDAEYQVVEDDPLALPAPQRRGREW